MSLCVQGINHYTAGARHQSGEARSLFQSPIPQTITFLPCLASSTPVASNVGALPVRMVESRGQPKHCPEPEQEESSTWENGKSMIPNPWTMDAQGSKPRFHS